MFEIIYNNCMHWPPLSFKENFLIKEGIKYNIKGAAIETPKLIKVFWITYIWVLLKIKKKQAI